MQSRFTFLVLVVAIVASVFAIWPAVADAPWEQESVVVESEAPDPRCEASLIMKAEARVAHALIPKGPAVFLVPIGESSATPNDVEARRELEELIEEADRDIRRYC